MLRAAKDSKDLMLLHFLNDPTCGYNASCYRTSKNYRLKYFGLSIHLLLLVRFLLLAKTSLRMCSYLLPHRELFEKKFQGWLIKYFLVAHDSFFEWQEIQSIFL